MVEVCAILLAAGLSRRMGDRNKLLLPVAGVRMIRRMVDTYRAAINGPVIVVTGHEAEAVAAALEGSEAKLVFNPDFAQGQPTSVACGLRHAPEGYDILIGLGDQPFLTGDDLNTLIAAHAAADPTRISIPMMQTQRGNPILVPSSLKDRLLADPRAPGCKKFTRENPDHVQFLTIAAQGFYADIDTPEAYRALTSTLETST
ncbi:nucleotidyltransferase family protein [Sulfitobacter sp.]|uniref:nucleotidyltransferase family protein n=1 Tax=Sulfitobacter sp. TaxID=1903071 RepID=UPI003299EB9C